MAFRSSNCWRSIANQIRGATYATSTPPKLKAYAPTINFNDHHHEHHNRNRLPLQGDFVPVYVALGMVCLSLSLGLITIKQQIAYAPNVRLRKKTRETIPELVDPDKVVDEAEKFVKKSFFRKVAHIQEFNDISDPVRKGALGDKYHVETLKDVGVDPKLAAA